MEAEEKDDTEVLKKIQEAEAFVEELISKAEEDARNSVQIAKVRAEKIFNEKCLEVDLEWSRILEKALREAEQNALLQIEIARKEASELLEKLNVRIDCVAMYILNKIYPDLKEGLF